MRYRCVSQLQETSRNRQSSMSISQILESIRNSHGRRTSQRASTCRLQSDDYDGLLPLSGGSLGAKLLSSPMIPTGLNLASKQYQSKSLRTSLSRLHRDMTLEQLAPLSFGSFRQGGQTSTFRGDFCLENDVRSKQQSIREDIGSRGGAPLAIRRLPNSK